MFLGYQGNKIVLAANSREELENAPCMVFDRIEESAEEYVLWGGEYILKAQAETAQEEQAKVLAVTTLEDRYGLPRATRTALLALQAQGVELDKQLMARVAEVEEAAAPLRANKGSAQDTGMAGMEADDDAGTV